MALFVPDPRNFLDVWNKVSQAFPPSASFTEANLPDLTDKVYVVTGANTGVGKELARMLYGRNAIVFLAARSESKTQAAISCIQQACPSSTGKMTFLHVDLADLSTIRATADSFHAHADKLHVLFNNAGVMMTPQGSKTAQGYEMQLGTNNLGTFLLTKLLTPTLVRTAKTAPRDSVRVVWVSSSAAEALSPRPGGVDMDNLDYRCDKHPAHKYGVSKAGNFLHAAEFARRHAADGVVSVALNPGNLRTDLLRHMGWLQKLVARPLQYPPVMGAYTELFAGLAPDVTVDRVKVDSWVVPWGRFAPIRSDMSDATRPKSEGGTGLGEAFWEWTEEQVKAFL